ncbi:hypothetical protein BJ741DRAFT_625671 [Chytriomyces cf. hyalinus JEL632]|nr:hypothetical protein BJ741DRAFT_625671 [Chytriomyces cf. hyalinus JEL632]
MSLPSMTSRETLLASFPCTKISTGTATTWESPTSQDCVAAASNNNQRFVTFVDGIGGQRRCYIKASCQNNEVTLVFPRGEDMIPGSDLNCDKNFNVYDPRSGGQVSQPVSDARACEQYCRNNAGTFCVAAAYFNRVCYPKIPTFSPPGQQDPNRPPVS